MIKSKRNQKQNAHKPGRGSSLQSATSPAGGVGIKLEGIMKTTSYYGGQDFSGTTIYEDWGDCGEGADYKATYKKLGDLVVARFHQIARENGSSARWAPQTSEVIHNVNESDELVDQYDDWRQQACDVIMSAWTDGEIGPVMK